MAIAASQQIDANSRTINSNEAILLTSVWTFAAATTGSVNAHTLFTVTGDNLVTVFGTCQTDITGTGTGEVGVAGNTPALIAQTTGTAIDAGEIWVDATPGTGVEALPGVFIDNGLDIILTIGTGTFTAGKINFYCLYRPLSSGAGITVTTAA